MDSELSPMPALAAPRIGGPGRRCGGTWQPACRLAGGQAGASSLHYISRRPRDTSPTVEDMGGIILEGVLFVALLATVAALLFYPLVRWTPLGLQLRQDANRRKIEQTLELHCPIHGPQREDEMLRLPSGIRICLTCYN